jgi:hypothetical protein
VQGQIIKLSDSTPINAEYVIFHVNIFKYLKFVEKKLHSQDNTGGKPPCFVSEAFIMKVSKSLPVSFSVVYLSTYINSKTTKCILIKSDTGEFY